MERFGSGARRQGQSSLFPELGRGCFVPQHSASAAVPRVEKQEKPIKSSEQPPVGGGHPPKPAPSLLSRAAARNFVPFYRRQLETELLRRVSGEPEPRGRPAPQLLPSELRGPPDAALPGTTARSPSTTAIPTAGRRIALSCSEILPCGGLEAKRETLSRRGGRKNCVVSVVKPRENLVPCRRSRRWARGRAGTAAGAKAGRFPAQQALKALKVRHLRV
ncbi:uncharacterized protein LOC142048899 [Phalacrocorax aristotelis]|uniref:uncharacterized protein LOC142048899 n=1 Tax=Phalacrocorax aristotelis TaxID=126867 RepID=UPI003F4C58BC